ncbi:MAG: peptidase [Thermoprotei archaeon]|nr:MAG: peptidase [Thermoprotei archaeon]
MTLMKKMCLNLLIDLKRGTLEGNIRVKLNENVKCFLLNKGLKIEYCNVEFSQRLIEFIDFKGYEVNFVELKSPMRELELKYSGTLESYEKLFPHLKDKISEEYTLLRTDTYFYPIFAKPLFKDLINTISTSSFDAEISISGIPSEYKIASGGEIQGNKLRMLNTWRLDIAIAKFSLIKSENLRAFVLRGNEEYGNRILRLLRKAFNFYCSMFGERATRYTIIEIPDGYGGQAGIDYSLIESKTLREPIPYGLYHELAHLWNPRAEGEVQRTRFFDEAFANYLTALLIREYYGEDEFEKILREFREVYWQLVGNRFPRGSEVPLAEYGKYEFGTLSYSKGALILYELHKLIGNSFYKLIRECYERFRDRPIDFKNFKALAEEISGRSLDDFFNEKIFGVWNP